MNAVQINGIYTQIFGYNNMIVSVTSLWTLMSICWLVGWLAGQRSGLSLFPKRVESYTSMLLSEHLFDAILFCNSMNRSFWKRSNFIVNLKCTCIIHAFFIVQEGSPTLLQVRQGDLPRPVHALALPPVHQLPGAGGQAAAQLHPEHWHPGAGGGNFKGKLREFQRKASAISKVSFENFKGKLREFQR